jgi:hypothetical protein
MAVNEGETYDLSEGANDRGLSISLEAKLWERIYGRWVDRGQC